LKRITTNYVFSRRATTQKMTHKPPTFSGNVGCYERIDRWHQLWVVSP